jgi:hypothetical protein
LNEKFDIVQQDLQNGANAGEANISATCNELIRLGLLVYKRDGEDGNQFDIEGYRRDLIRKAAGSREGTVLIATLLAEMYLKMTGKDGEGSLEDTLDMILSGINTAENEAEARHFINEKNKSVSRTPRAHRSLDGFSSQGRSLFSTSFIFSFRNTSNSIQRTLSACASSFWSSNLSVK